MKRRDFIQNLLKTGVAISLPSVPLTLLGDTKNYQKLTILHTNDVHSRIEPFDSGSFKGMGGAAQRAAIIQQIRNRQEHVLLLDAGDIFQGTPYFNKYEGEVEFKVMNELGYDASTIGNHDFDKGMDVLAKYINTAQFPILNANYNFDNTPLKNTTKPYKIFNKGSLKIGVFGIGLELDGLVPDSLYGNTKYLDPIQKANEVALQLKQLGCQLIVCLSHLGFKYEGSKVSDEVLAKNTKYIDFIIGGHTHTFMELPNIYINKIGKGVVVNQVGWGGIQLGKVDFYFHKNFDIKELSSESIKVIDKLKAETEYAKSNKGKATMGHFGSFEKVK